MYIACCENCRYLDLMLNEAAKCPRCKGKMVSLDVDSAKWNSMSIEDKEALLDEKVPRQQDVKELFEEWFALKTDKEEDTAVPDIAEPGTAEDDKEKETVIVPAQEMPVVNEYVYVCYKCNSIAGHDGKNDRYYCPDCGSDMVETGLNTLEWASLSKEEKRNATEEAKIRHMVTAIKEASYEESETEKTQNIINVVGNSKY